ncbi:MAG: hypothetical protein WBQ27_08845 [Thermoanaerobaculia bacterium]
MSRAKVAKPMERLECLEERLRRARASLLEIEGEVATLRRELGETSGPEPEPRPPATGEQLVTVRQFAERQPAFTESSLRWIRYRSQPIKRLRRGGREEVVPELETNGFESAFVKVGRRILIDEREFSRCLERQRGK